MRMTEEQYREYDDMNIGPCKNREAERGCCEPDARNYPCEECGEDAVDGVQELLLAGLIEFEEE